MKLKRLTDPFSGIEMSVAEFEDGSLIANEAYTHECIAIAYNQEIDAYMIPAKYFELRHTMTLQEAADYLSVSKMRVSTLCMKGQLQSEKLGNIVFIDYDSVVEYSKNRKGYGAIKNDTYR